MKTHLYMVYRKGERGLRVVADRFDYLALLLPPVWLVWHGLWIALTALVLLVAAVAALLPLAVLPVLYGIAFLLAFEGGTVIGAELYLRGWREVATVEARSDAGAEELYLTGEAA